MSFDPIVYMEWAKAGTRASINLARSGLPGLEFSDLGLNLRLEDLRINGDHPYGWAPLIEAIAARYGVDPECVVPTVGTSQAIFIACAALMGNGDGAYVEKPAYEPLRSVPRSLGGVLHRFNRLFERGFSIDSGEFEERFPEGAKVVLLSNLHNPSGVLLAPETIEQIAQAAARRGAILVIDEVYREFELRTGPLTSFGLADNIMTISSLTKVFGLSGLRCGWMLVPRPMIRRVRQVVDNLHVEHVFPAEQISARIFPLLDVLKEKNRGWIEANKAVVRQFIQETPRLEWVEPDAGIVAFPRVAGVSGADAPGDRLARRLIENGDTAVVPGSFFEDGRHIRLGFGLQGDDLRRGLDRVRAAL